MCIVHKSFLPRAARGEVGDFALGQRDVSDRFQLPGHLYGRDREIASLLAAFERDIAAAGCGGWCTPAGAPTPAMRALMRRAGAEEAEGALVKRFEWAACGVRCRPR